MKQKLLLLVAILSLNVVTAQEFEEAGIKYNITSDTTVEVIANDPVYSGAIEIPAKVTNSNSSLGAEYNVTAIGEEAFYECDELTSIILPASVTTIGEVAFKKCKLLSSIILPDGLTSIGEDAFSECSSLESISIPVGVTTIPGNAFYKCTSLETVTILGPVTEIGEGAFYRNSSLANITIPSTLTSIADQAFIECKSLTSITIPVGVTAIPYQAFYKCVGLETVTILGPVTSIGQQAFSRCEVLTSITLPDSLTEIGVEAFKQCEILPSIAIPANVTSIGDEAFSKCYELSNVSVAVVDPATITLGTDVFLSVEDIEEATLTVPTGSVLDYEAAPQWSDFGNIVAGTLSTNNEVLAASFSVYPNPVQNTLFIKHNSEQTLKSVSVYNVQGKQVLNTTNSSVDVASLAKGMYLVKITTNVGSTTKKLIKI